MEKKKAEQLQFIAENGAGMGRDSIEYEENRFGDLSSADDYLGAGPPGDDEYRNVRALRVIERQHRKMHRVDCFVDPDTGDQRDVPEAWNDRKAKKFAKEYGLNIISRLSARFVGLLRAITSFFTTIGLLTMGSLLFLISLTSVAVVLLAWSAISLVHKSSSIR